MADLSQFTNHHLLAKAITAHQEYMREEAASVGYNADAASGYQRDMYAALAELKKRRYDVSFSTGKLVKIETCDEGAL